MFAQNRTPSYCVQYKLFKNQMTQQLANIKSQYICRAASETSSELSFSGD